MGSTMGSDAEWSSSYSEEGTAARANSGHWSEIKIVPRIQNWKLWFAVPQTKIDLTRGVLTLACQGEGEVNVPLVRTICLFGHSCVIKCHWQFPKRKRLLNHDLQFCMKLILLYKGSARWGRYMFRKCLWREVNKFLNKCHQIDGDYDSKWGA